MHYELYVDRLFFVQFLMTLLLLMMTAALGKLHIRLYRLIMSAVLGSLLYLLCFLLPLGSGLTAEMGKPLMHTMSTLIVVGACFGLNGMGAYVRAGLIYGICACLLGGVITFLFDGTIKSQWQVIIPTSALTLGSVVWTKIERRHKKHNRYLVCIQEGNYRLKVQALLDSGNSLADPISGAPVCIVHKSVIERLGLSKKPERFRAIPYHSIGKQHGILKAWSAEKVWIRSGGQNLTFERVLLAESVLPLSETEEYQMLLHPALLEEKKGDNHDFKSCNAGTDAV